MVKHLIDQIMPPNSEFNIEVNICRSSHSSAFLKSSTDLSTVVARIYSSDNPLLVRFRKLSIYDTDRGDHCSGIGGSFDVRCHGRRLGETDGRGRGGHGQGGCGGGSGSYENGIDISYVTCYFEDLE